MLRISCLSVGLSLLIAPALGQTVILGNSPAAACYQAVSSNIANNTATINKCTEAIKWDQTGFRDRHASRINRGIIHMRRGDYENAILDFDNALKMKPNSSEAHLNKGAVQIHQGDYASAVHSLQKALELGTDRPEAAYFNLGLAYEAMENYQLAYEHFLEAQKLKPHWTLVSQQLDRFELG